MEREDEVRPVGMGENPVGAGSVPLQAPANSEKGGQNLAGFDGSVPGTDEGLSS